MENWQKYWGVVDCSPPGFSGQESGKEGTDTKQTNKQKTIIAIYYTLHHKAYPSFQIKFYANFQPENQEFIYKAIFFFVFFCKDFYNDSFILRIREFHILFATLWNVAHWALLSMGILWATVLE